MSKEYEVEEPEQDYVPDAEPENIVTLTEEEVEDLFEQAGKEE